MTQQLLFDLDDTLIYCNRYFFRAIDDFANQLVAWFSDAKLSPQDVKDKQAAFDTELIQQSGFKSEHFPNSFIETYNYYCDKLRVPQAAAHREWLWQIGMEVYNHKTEAYPFMEETLSQLQHEGHELHLYTGGEPHIQLRKIEDMELSRFFEQRIYVRQVKNIDALEQILQQQQFERTKTWMIGNSIRNDIVPALHAGIHAIHVEIPDEWHHNIIDVNIQPRGRFLSVQSLQQIPSIISSST